MIIISDLQLKVKNIISHNFLLHTEERGQSSEDRQRTTHCTDIRLFVKLRLKNACALSRNLHQQSLKNHFVPNIWQFL